MCQIPSLNRRFRVKDRTTKVYDWKNDAVNMIVRNESTSLWKWELAGKGNKEVLTQESGEERVSLSENLRCGPEGWI